jgi:hypothetical protein
VSLSLVLVTAVVLEACEVLHREELSLIELIVIVVFQEGVDAGPAETALPRVSGRLIGVAVPAVSRPA